MIVTTTETVPGREVIEIVGIAKGNAVRARHLGRDIFAGLKNLVGGEISEYTKLLAQSREQTMQRLVADAQRMGGDAVVNVRMTTSMVMDGTSEILAYGTVVKLSL
ncbi:MAG: YbjQ family protein [Flavobacteriaceae bacterium]|nr:YbjQ family protein [Flavobacteriaceae bacterium]